MSAHAPAKPYRPGGRGVLLTVRLTPKSSRNAIEGVRSHAGRRTILARVRAAPEKGKANAALEAVVAKWLGVAKSHICVVAGHTARLKTVQITGDAAAIAAALDAKLEHYQGKPEPVSHPENTSEQLDNA